jgi:octaprenyl-diphosphate synthase
MRPGKLGQVSAVKEIFSLIKDDLRKVEREIALESVASVDAITAIGRYLQSSGGKRLRPSLVLLVAKMIGDSSNGAVRMAAVMEMIHTATLVHDDVIDTAQTRRGQPSTNIQWGNHTSVLAGDWLYMQAFHLAVRERNFRILDILITLTQMMVEGELLQMDRLGRLDISEADYMELVDRKTARLFSACTRMGALVGGAELPVEDLLSDYGWNLGMAFQLTDDVLDFTAREHVLGKPVGSDLREGKVTLPLIYALEQAAPGERRQIETILRERSYEQVSFDRVLAIIQRYNGFERAQQRGQAFIQRAREVISGFPESPYQRSLLAITELITERDH